MLRVTHPCFPLTRTRTPIDRRGGCDSRDHETRYVPGFDHPPMSVVDGLPDAADG